MSAFGKVPWLELLFREDHDRLVAVAEAPLISPNIGLLRGFEVAPRERNEIVAARSTQRFDHFDVVATRLIVNNLCRP